MSLRTGADHPQMSCTTERGKQILASLEQKDQEMEYLSHAPLRWSAWFPWSIDPQDKPWEGKELYFVYLGGRHLPVDTRQ